MNLRILRRVLQRCVPWNTFILSLPPAGLQVKRFDEAFCVAGCFTDPEEGVLRIDVDLPEESTKEKSGWSREWFRADPLHNSPEMSEHRKGLTPSMAPWGTIL